MKALFCGPRDWTRRWVVRQEMGLLPEGATIVHGGASGADTYADFAAQARGFVVRTYFADWAAYGLAAGGRRNQHMLDMEHPYAEDGSLFDLCVAFCYDPTALTKGTGDMVRRAKKSHIPVRLVDPTGSVVIVLPEGEGDADPIAAWERFDGS